MWQHAANIIVGLVLVALAIFGLLLGAVETLFAWVFMAAGAAIIVLGFWGLMDEFDHEQNKEGGM